MSEETEARVEKVTDKDEAADAVASKEEKLDRVAEKLKAMGMMPGKENNEIPDKSAKSRRGSFMLIGLVATAFAIASLSYVFIKLDGRDKIAETVEHNTSGAANYAVTDMPMATQAVIVWPKPLSVTQIEQLQEARNLYWQHEHNKAEEHYSRLLADVKDQPDLYGELGDVQFYSGNHTAASENYVKAASLLIEQNRFSEVGHAISVVARFDHVKANELMEKMAARHYVY